MSSPLIMGSTTPIRRTRREPQTEEWVRGDVHTNGVEGVWSLFKRSIVGSYHQVSAKHFSHTLTNLNGDSTNATIRPFFRDTLVRMLNAPKMEFKELIEKSA